MERVSLPGLFAGCWLLILVGCALGTTVFQSFIGEPAMLLMVMWLLVIWSIFAGPIAFYRVFAHSEKIAYASMLLLAIVSPLLAISCARSQPNVAQLAVILARLDPLIEATTEYAERMGRPPATVGQLVPEYLDSVPGLGLVFDPGYRYLPGHGPDDWSISIGWADSFDWDPDRIVFRSDQDYVDHALTVRIDGWLYEINP